MEVFQIPHEQLKHEFEDVLFKAMDARAVHHVLLSTSTSDSTSVSMSYEDYRVLHRVLCREDIRSLHHISEKLRSTDHFQDCVQIYITRRKETVDMISGQLQKKMNVEALDVFAYWEELSQKIQRWIQVARICIHYIFVQEKSLYEHIFGGSGTGDDAECGYVHIIGDSAAKLFEFPESLMSGRRLTRKLEVLLPLYQEFLNLMPVVEALFPKDVCLPKSIRDRASGVFCRLTQQIKRLISDSERHVLRELSTGPAPGGAIHPLTENVICYLDLIFNYRKSLSDLIGTLEGSNDLTAPGLDSLEFEQDQTIPLKHHLTRIVEYLLYNLRYKSKFYEHESLGHLFMMNNVHCVAQKIGNSQGLLAIIGHNYLMKLRNKVKEAMTDHLKTTWNCVFLCLREEGSKPQSKWSSLFGKSERAVKEKLKAFNLMIENVQQRLEEWEVPDKQLRQKLRQSILETLIPAYSHFLGQHSRQIDKFRQAERYIKYSVKELEREILALFLFQELAQTAA